jgi:DNA-binding transcriptional LysR family regulator
MDLLQLHYLLTVARLEHMTKAAEELRITQPALSKMIARLEDELGVPLFDRQNRQIRLNEFGKAFCARVEKALALLEEGRREVADMAGLERGIVSIATNSLKRLSEAIAAFRERHPDVRFRIVQIAPTETDEMANMLERGEVDLCFSATALRKPGISERPVLSAEVFLAVPRGHRLGRRRRVSLRDVADEPFIEYKEGHPFREVNETICRKAGIWRNVVCEVEEPAAVDQLVRAGLGVAFVPAGKGDQRPAYPLLKIDEPNCRRDYLVSWKEERYLSKAARAFMAFLADHFAAVQRGDVGQAPSVELA